MGGLELNILDVGTRESGLCLGKTIHLFDTCLLTEVEVLRQEIARCVELTLVVGQVLGIGECLCAITLSLDLGGLSLCLLISLGGDGLVCIGDGIVGILDEGFVTGLGISLSLDTILLHSGGLIDDVLDEHHDTTGTAGLLVLGVAGWWWWSGGTWLTLEESLLLFLVEDFKAGKGLLKDGLSCALIGSCELEFVVTGFTGLAGLLRLNLSLGDDSMLSLDVLGERIDGCLGHVDGGTEISDLTLLDGSLLLVLLEFINAPVTLDHFILLLLLKGNDHLVDCRLDLLEGIDLDGGRKGDEAQVVVLPANGADGFGGRVADSLVLHVGLDESHGASHGVVRVVIGEDGDCFRDGGDLIATGLGAETGVVTELLATELKI